LVPDVRYLLDTHAWLWALLGHARLGAAARRVLAGIGEDEPIGLAAISLKEAAWLLARGRVAVKRDPAAWADWLRDAAAAPGLDVLPLTVEVAIESERLPDDFPSDPADRLIAATARLHDLTLLTADRAMRARSELRTLW
jgi:PIN domain nuclease of toxin-antitoxin system